MAPVFEFTVKFTFWALTEIHITVNNPIPQSFKKGFFTFPIDIILFFLKQGLLLLDKSKSIVFHLINYSY